MTGHHNVLIGLPLSGRSVRNRHGRHSRGGKGHHRHHHHKGKHLKAPEEEHRPGEGAVEEGESERGHPLPLPSPRAVRSPKLGNVGFFINLIHFIGCSLNRLLESPNFVQLWISYYLASNRLTLSIFSLTLILALASLPDAKNESPSKVFLAPRLLCTHLK